MNEEFRCKPSEPQQSEGLRKCAERVLIALRLLRVGSGVNAAISALEASKESTLPRTQSPWEAVELLTKANAELALVLSVALDALEKSTAQPDQDSITAINWIGSEGGGPSLDVRDFPSTVRSLGGHL
jgi:hypothetical protein